MRLRLHPGQPRIGARVRRDRGGGRGLAVASSHCRLGDALAALAASRNPEGGLRAPPGSGPATGRCVGKTGTLSNVSALSGYCEATSGDTYVYSILMNYIAPPGANAFHPRLV